MNDKEKYLQMMKINNGKLDEIALGETIGLNEETTRKILHQLLSEYRIAFEPFGHSNYRVKR
jgi:hypothetical protein